MITIDLQQRIPGGFSIEFLRLEMADEFSPFALIRYARNGEEQSSGLRLDLEKLSFLDHFEDQDEERVIDSAATSGSFALGMAIIGLSG